MTPDLTKPMADEPVQRVSDHEWSTASDAEKRAFVDMLLRGNAAHIAQAMENGTKANQERERAESAEAQLKTVLDREAATIKRHDERIAGFEAQVKALREALNDLEAALRADSRDKTILQDTVEYHLDGQAMYAAINKVRAALAQKGDANGG